MQEAYNLYSKKEYKKASSTLNLILDIFPVEVLAERDILKIRCFSKTMASNEIQDIIVRANDIRKIIHLMERKIYGSVTHKSL